MGPKQDQNPTRQTNPVVLCSPLACEASCDETQVSNNLGSPHPVALLVADLMVSLLGLLCTQLAAFLSRCFTFLAFSISWNLTIFY